MRSRQLSSMKSNASSLQKSGPGAPPAGHVVSQPSREKPSRAGGSPFSGRRTTTATGHTVCRSRLPIASPKRNRNCSRW